MFQSLVIVIVSLADDRTSSRRKVQLGRIPGDKNKVMSRKAREQMLDGATPNASGSRKDAHSVTSHYEQANRWNGKQETSSQ
jgi:hypothetical protein